MANAGIGIALSCYGQFIGLDPIVVGETVNWALTCEDPAARTPIDVTNWTFAFSLAALDLFGSPIAPPVLQTSPAIVSAPAGTISTAWTPANTKTLAPGRYMLDLWGTDGSGGRLRLLSALLLLAPSATPAP
jgi:hypothetical protein